MTICPEPMVRRREPSSPPQLRGAARGRGGGEKGGRIEEESAGFADEEDGVAAVFRADESGIVTL